MADPITMQTMLGNINLTVVIAIATVCVSVVAIILNTFKKKKEPIELPGESIYCKQQKIDMERIEKSVEDSSARSEELRKITTGIEKEVALLKQGCDNINKSMEEMKQNNREVALRLDNLLRQLMEWMND